MKKKLRKQIHNEYPWWDESNLLLMVRDWLEHSSKMYSKHGSKVHSHRTAKEMKIATNLIDRINNHNYLESNKVFPCRNMGIDNVISRGRLLEVLYYNPKADHLKKQDVDYLFNFMKKHILTWWD